MKVSIVVPTLNEEAAVAPLLENLSRLGGNREILFVDGGSRDETLARINGGARVLSSLPGRWRQLNTGAARASGEALLFLHADSFLPDRALDRIRGALRTGFVGGCFLNRFHEGGWTRAFSDPYRDLRTRLLHDFYGDNAIFVRRDAFRRLGGFARLPVMEDYDLVVRMRRLGRIHVVPDRVLTSSRRFRRNGWIRQALRNQWIKIAYRMRWSLDDLYV